MQVINDVHRQFAEYFTSETLKPYLYLLSKKLSEGHICVDVDKIDKEELASVGYNNLLNKKKLQNEALVSDGKEIKPVVFFKGRLYLQRYFRYETIILNRIKQLIKNEQVEVDSRASELNKHTNLIKNLFRSSGEDRAGKGNTINWPLVAAITSVLNNFTIITGPP